MIRPRCDLEPVEVDASPESSVRRGLKIAVTAIAAAVCAAPAGAADNGDGKALAQARCVQCHEADDWEGEDAAALESLIRDIVAGKVKHKTKLDLTPAQMSAIAAFWSASSNK